MTQDDNLPPWRQRVQAERAARLAEEQAQQPDQHDSDLVPEPVFDKTEQQTEVDSFIDRLTCVEAYRKFCGKSNPTSRPGQTEGIKISCPIPGHPDKNPSAWINTKEGSGGVWFCGGCQEGGDKFDIAAYHFGYPVPGYKSGADFHNLRREMAEAYGYTWVKTLASPFPVAVPPESVPKSDPSSPAPDKSDKSDTAPDKSPKSDTLPEQESGDSLAPVVELYSKEEDTLFPHLDWRRIVTPETFLDSYLQETTKDDVPEEFHFWNGLLALGLAMGRDARMKDTVTVYGNLFVCTLGHSGSGKSKAKYHLDKLLVNALPHDYDDGFSKGTVKINAPGSAEALIQAFSKPVRDPTDDKKIAFYAPVRGLVDFNELSALVGRASRAGNVTKPTLQQLYDMEDEVSTTSISHGQKKAKLPYASAITTTQPRAVSTLLTQADADSGFLNRWIFAAGPYKQRVMFSEAEINLTIPIKKLQEVLAWAATRGKPLEKDDDAKKLLIDFFHGTIEQDQKNDETGMLTRLDLLMKKLSLLFAANDRKDTIDKACAEKAIAVYPYVKACYLILSDKIGNTLESECQAEIERHLRRMKAAFPAGVTSKQLKNVMKRKPFSLNLIVQVLRNMEILGYINESVSKRGTDVTRRYQIAD